MDHSRWKGGTPAWADAGTSALADVPELWRHAMIAEHYESARRWVDYVHSRNPNMRWEKALGNKFNDWPLNGDTLFMEGWPRTGGASCWRPLFSHTRQRLLPRWPPFSDAKTTPGNTGRCSTSIKAAFHEKYVKPDGRIEGDTQQVWASRLRFNLLPERLHPKAYMVDGFTRYGGHMSTGIQERPTG